MQDQGLEMQGHCGQRKHRQSRFDRDGGKLELDTTDHPSPYKVSWLQKGHQVSVTKQCLVDFKMGEYKDKVLCDVIPMDVCHVLLGRPWQYDRNVVHDGRMNTYTLEKDGRTHRLLPKKDEEVKPEVSSTPYFS
jgi:hypothetical protein